MGAYLGVAAPTGPSQNRAGDGPESSSNKRPGAGKEAAKKSSVESDGVTGVTGGGGGTEGATGHSQTGLPDVTGATQTGVSGETAKKKPLYSQCGLEDDSDEWEEYLGPERIRESRLTPEERARFQGHLKSIFSYESAVLGVRRVFKPEDVEEVMEKVIPYLESEPMLIDDVPFNVNIVADLHGQLYDLHRIFKHDAKDGKPGWECRKFIFLGDYVDRGKQSLEIVMALFCIKMLQPDDIFILRGNHEFVNINFSYGFYKDIKFRYEPETAKILYILINKTFCYLSIAAITGNKYFCAHGGISLEGFTRDNLKSICKPVISCDEDTLIQDLVWSDPAIGLKSSCFNGLRGSSNYFSLQEVARALHTMEVDAIFRGHSVLDEGYDVKWHCVVMLFSATATRERNKGAVARLDENGKLSFDVLEVSDRRELWEDELRKLGGEKLKQDDHDQKTQYEMGTGKIVKIGGGR